MPKTKSKIRTTKKAKQPFKFKWWIGFGVIAAVAVAGFVVVRFSLASTLQGQPTGTRIVATDNITRNNSSCAFGHLSFARVDLTYLKSATRPMPTCVVGPLQSFQSGVINNITYRQTFLKKHQVCVVGRYAGEALIVLWNGNTKLGQKLLSADAAKTRGYNDRWIADPYPGTGGGEINLICGEIPSGNSREWGISVANASSGGYLFVYYLTAYEVQ